MRIATIEEREAYFAKRAKGRKATEQNGAAIDTKVKQGRASSRQEIADWLNALAHKVSIEKSALNPNGYFATAENIG
jgi:hypothetical protein